MMTNPLRRPALAAVLLFGLVASIGAPKFARARTQAHDEIAKTDLRRAIQTVEQFHVENMRYPATMDEAGFVPMNGVSYVVWKVQDVGGVTSVHLHARHGESPHQFHAHYPAEQDIVPLPWEW